MATSNLIRCDISELIPPPYGDAEPIALKGQSAAQVTFATSVRRKKLDEWEPDLPPTVRTSLLGISDATWWLANQHNDSSNIKWPESWKTVRNPVPVAPSQPNLQASRNNVLGQLPKSDQDVEKFEAFARKACQSPELAYLTMMAFLFRQTKSPLALLKFTEARQKIGGHLDAIDEILGSPGAE